MMYNHGVSDRHPNLSEASSSPGPDWDAAARAGVDVALIEDNAGLTVTERLENLHQMTVLFEALHGRVVARSEADNAPEHA